MDIGIWISKYTHMHIMYTSYNNIACECGWLILDYYIVYTLGVD